MNSKSLKRGKRMSYEDIMRASRWLDKLRDNGVKITDRKIMTAFSVNQSMAGRLKKANLNSKAIP